MCAMPTIRPAGSDVDIDDPLSGPEVDIDEARWTISTAIVMVLIAGSVIAETGDAGLGDLLLLLVPALAFVIRWTQPRLPRAVLLIASFAPSILFNLNGLRTESAIFFSIAAITYLMIFEPVRPVAYVGGLITVLAPYVASEVSGFYDWGWPFWITGALLGVAFGEIGYRYRLRLFELKSARVQLAEHAVLEERRRIARDVHDLVGHSLSVMMLQVSAARALVRRDPDEAEAALDDAAKVGREGMAQIRRTVGLLRHGDADGSLPTPTVADIGDLVEQYRSAGLDVEFQLSGDPADLDEAVALAAYRIAQEALANAAKHGDGTSANVDIAIQPTGCRILIVNPVRVSALAGPEPSVGGGFGLIGMRERAASLGGTLVAAATRSGAATVWRVDALLPIHASDAAISTTTFQRGAVSDVKART